MENTIVTETQNPSVTLQPVVAKVEVPTWKRALKSSAVVVAEGLLIGVIAAGTILLIDKYKASSEA